MSTISAPDIATALEYQTIAFSAETRRATLMQAAKPNVKQSIRVRIHRNQTFEFVGSLLNHFLCLSGLEAEIVLSDYDDSLSLPITGESDVEVIWLDYDRYTERNSAFVDWLAGRIEALRARSSAPILVSPCLQVPGEIGKTEALLARSLEVRLRAVTDCHILPMNTLAEAMGADFIDTRFASFSGTRLSEKANIEVARHFGLHWIPAVMFPRLKAVVFDLDNTLWHGVLGEGGVDGLRIDEGYRTLHREIARLAESGLFVALLSKNTPEDVDAVFRSGRLALTSNQIDARSIGWGKKSDGLRAIADTLKIGLDSILFVDDNPGELLEVATHHPETRLLLAGPSPEKTIRALRLFPGLFSWGKNEADRLRSKDIASEEQRKTLQSAVTPEEYLASLQVRIRLGIDPTDQRDRLHQLSNKTNQFNLALGRLSETEIQSMLDHPDKTVVSMSLSDRFSDSGLIGLMVTEHEPDSDHLEVTELCISCRALGRGIEDAMMAAALNAALEQPKSPPSEIVFRYRKGPRNAPALTWLSHFTGQDPSSDHGTCRMPWDKASRDRSLADLPIKFEKGTADGA